MNLFKMLLTAEAGTGEVESVVPDITIDWSALLNTVVNWVLSTGIKIVIALIVMFISFKIINAIAKRIQRSGELPNRDKTIMKTLAYLVRIGAKCIVLVCLIGYLGIDTHSATAASCTASKSQPGTSFIASLAPSMLTGEMATLSITSSLAVVLNDARPYMLSLPLSSKLSNGFANSATKYMRWFFAHPLE